jgi:hypothetical protein
MWKRVALCLGTMALIVGVASVPLSGYAGVMDYLPIRSDPPTLTQVARMIDCIQNDILNQGTVVIKQPDIWSQARMTKFRKEFEDTMSTDLNKFQTYISAQIARSDAASFSSQTALAASISPVATPVAPQGGTTTSELTAATSLLGTGSTLPLPFGTPTNVAPGTAVVSNFSLLAGTNPNQTTVNPTTGALQNTPIPLGLEPTVTLDEKADYITHLHRLRRINLGDDNADSAGYGLYLMRVPVSILPGDKTVKGYGAVVNITMRHEFSPKFLPITYRNLVISDVVDMLAPVIHELIRTGKAKEYNDAVVKYIGPPASGTPALNTRASFEKGQTSRDLINKIRFHSNVPTLHRPGPRTYAIAPSDVKRVFVTQNLLNLAYAAQEALDLGDSSPPDTNKVRMTDVRGYLTQELQGAYDLMEGRCHEAPPLLMDVEYIEKLTDMVYSRKYEGPKGAPVDSEKEFNDFYTYYEGFTHRLPGNLRFRPVGALCWAIAVDAGLLNRQLREDMKDTQPLDGYTCPPDIDRMVFYPPYPAPEAEATFQGYVRAKWPMISFALEPVTDQQNIEDAFTRRRDLQLAVSFALAGGQINFRQAITYTRQLQYEAQTIALNRTVAAFAHGNDNFGWQISPRYQTPPEESNLRAVTNLLLRGGPGPNYGLKNSKIEPGQREMTAVVVMPSFVTGLRLDVANNWFRLHDPDDYKVHTARTVELGRRINETRAALASADTCGLYRPEDVERLRVRLYQLEAMLPLQTAHVKVPYENTLGGFALFTQGATALVPELSGYEGIEYIDPSQACDIILYGKHFSIYESAVVVGGVALQREGTTVLTVTDPTTGKASLATNSLTPLRNADGSLYLVTPSGAAVPIKDTGSYDILSREVLRVRIPPGVKTATREDGSTVVEVYVATSTGISNRLLIPVAPGVPSSAAAGKGAGYVLLDDNLPIPLAAHAIPGSKTQYDLPPDALLNQPIRVQPINPGPNPPPAAVNLTFNFPTAIGTLSMTIANVQFDGTVYAVSSTQLTKFATDLLTLLSSNGLLPPPPPPASYLTAKTVTVQTVPQVGVPSVTSTTVNSFNVNLQANLVPGKTSAVAPTPTGAALAASAPANIGARPIAPAAPPLTATSSIPLPRRVGQTTDSMARRAAFQADAPAVPGLSPVTPNLTLPSGAFVPPVPPPGVPLPPQIEALPTQLQTLSDRTSALSEKTAALTAQVSTVLSRPLAPPQNVVMISPPSPPVVNVTVPVTNQLRTPKHQGFFHRRPAMRPNPLARP